MALVEVRELDSESAGDKDGQHHTGNAHQPHPARTGTLSPKLADVATIPLKHYEEAVNLRLNTAHDRQLHHPQRFTRMGGSESIGAVRLPATRLNRCVVRDAGTSDEPCGR